MTVKKPFNSINGGTGTFALDGKYARIVGYFAAVDSQYKTKTSLKIYGDDVLLGEYEHESGTVPIQIDISLIGVQTLRIETNGWFCNVEPEKFN